MSSPITVIGNIVDASNNPATSGYVEFALTPLNEGLAYQVLPNQVIASVSRGMINSSGQFVAADGVSPCLVWPNDLILPSNTLYRITIAPNNEVTRVYNNVLLKSTQDPQSLASLTFILPQPVVGTVIEGSPLVTETVIPSLDNIFDLGDPQHRYAHVYTNVLDDFLQNLTVNDLHVTGYIDNPNPGQNLIINDSLSVNGDLDLEGCLYFETDGNTHTDRLCPATGANYAHQLPTTNGTLAPLAGPIFTGNPQSPTPDPSSNDNSIATTAFVQAFIAPSSPVTSVFSRIGAITALAGDYTVAKVTGAAPLASPALTGNPTAPTQTLGDNTTKLATTAFVQAALTALGFTIVLGDPGHIIFPGGLILQWFTATNDPAGVNPNYTKTFPFPFPTACDHVQLTYEASGNNDWYIVVSYTKTTVTIGKRGTGGSDSSSNALIFAIGH